MSPLRKTTPFARLRRIRSKRRCWSCAKLAQDSQPVKSASTCTLEPKRRSSAGTSSWRSSHCHWRSPSIVAFGSGLRTYGPGSGWPDATRACGPGLVVGAPELARRQRRPVVSQVRQDHLHALAGRAEDIGRVNAVALAARRVGGLLPEVEEDFSRLFLHRVVAAGVVLSEVMVVPHRDHRGRRAQARNARNRRELRVLRGQDGHVARIAVDVVAEEDEEVILPGKHRVPDRLRLVDFGAGAECDALQRAPERGMRIRPCVRRCGCAMPMLPAAARVPPCRRAPATGGAACAALDRDRVCRARACRRLRCSLVRPAGVLQPAGFM